MGRFIDFLLAKPTIKKENVHENAHHRIIDNQEVLEELRKLKTMIAVKEKRSGYKGIDYVLQMMHNNRIGQVLIDDFVQKMEHESTVELLNDIDYVKKALKKFFEERLVEYKQPKQKGKQRKIILIGPTGVGKTTALFKIVSLFELLNKDIINNKTCIRVANFDNHKIGSKESFEKAIECMEIKGESFIKIDDLVEYMLKVESSEILLVDTTGKNPKNKREILEITQLLEPIVNNGEVFLVIPANMSEGDLRYIFQEFNLLKYNGVILTKLDETLYPATALGICMEFASPVVFISEGKSYSGEFFMPTTEDLLKYFHEI